MKKIFKGIFFLVSCICIIYTFWSLSFFASDSAGLNSFIYVYDLIQSEFYREPDSETLFEGAVRGMVASLGDPYSIYFTADEVRENNKRYKGVFGGVGIYVAVEEENIVVVSPIEGTPGAEAGLRPGDVLLEADGYKLSGLSIDEAVGYLKGDIGSLLVLRYRRGDTETEVEIIRGEIPAETVRSAVLEDNPEIGYMRITYFASNTDEAVDEQLQEMLDDGIKGLIMDLRYNPGGDLKAVVNIAGRFIPEGPVVFISDREGNTDHYEGAKRIFDLPLVVLVNEGSASASEILAGAVKDTGSGIIVGQTTFGKGIVQTVYDLGSFGGVNLTTNVYRTPDFNDIHEKGISPDYEVANPDYTEDNFEDLQFEKALEIMEENI